MILRGAIGDHSSQRAQTGCHVASLPRCLKECLNRKSFSMGVHDDFRSRSPFSPIPSHLDILGAAPTSNSTRNERVRSLWDGPLLTHRTTAATGGLVPSQTLVGSRGIPRPTTTSRPQVACIGCSTNHYLGLFRSLRFSPAFQVLRSTTLPLAMMASTLMEPSG